MLHCIMGLFWGGLSPFLWSVTCLLLRRFVFRIEASAKREWLVTKRSRPWEGRRRHAKRHFALFLLPIFLCVQIFIQRERNVLVRGRTVAELRGKVALNMPPNIPIVYFDTTLVPRSGLLKSCLWTFKKNCACFTLHTNRRGPFQSLLISV